MREDTLQFETQLRQMQTALERAGGMPLSDVFLHLREVRRFLLGCVDAGCDRDLIVTMERVGLGHLVEALLPIVR